jgi:hypothetical protein
MKEVNDLSTPFAVVVPGNIGAGEWVTLVHVLECIPEADGTHMPKRIKRALKKRTG